VATLPEVYADFQNADPQGRVRLNSVGTVNDLARLNLPLSEGLELLLYSDDADQDGDPKQLVIEGSVAFSSEEHCWVARIDWNQIRQRAIDSPPAASPVLPAAIDPLGARPASTP
jgi:hypothetical protein